MAAEFNVTASTIRAHLLRLGIPLHAPGYRSPFADPKRLETMLLGYQMGDSIAALAVEYGVSENAIYSALKRSNVALRGRRVTMQAADIEDPEGPRNPGHMYAEYLNRAAKRGSKAAQAYLGGPQDSE
ncbi:hypothetical protein [Bradyrhizobium elkanii]|uniref:hypothetical protein n=1 Tax=Bradyrhizobium elkanii TaxID=29448 RepID=UPI003D242030